jgi:hypothetical protein
MVGSSVDHPALVSSQVTMSSSKRDSLLDYH